MASEALLQALAESLSKPSRAYRTTQAALNIPQQALEGYLSGAKVGDEIRKRKLEKMSLSEALGGNVPEGLQGFGDTTVEGATTLAKPIEAIAALHKALQEKNSNRGLQFVGTQGGKGVLFDPNKGLISTTGLPDSQEPIIPKAVAPSLSPYADPATGQPLAYTPGRGLAPTQSTGASGGTPVLKQGNEQAISDTALMQTQAPNIDKLFDAYKQLGPLKARAQASPLGEVLDPASKQLENSLKLSAFTFGGKNLTGQEKQVVFGAFFPSFTDNEQSREQKRALLKNYFSGKIDLLQAANLLGPAGAPLQQMLKSKINQDTTTGDPEADAAIAQINAAPISDKEKQVRIAGIRAASGRKQ